jgi:hypothetical protein
MKILEFFRLAKDGEDGNLFPNIVDNNSQRVVLRARFSLLTGALFLCVDFLMASQRLTNCGVAAMALVTAAYRSTPQSSTIARLAFGAFCLAIHSSCFLAKASIFGARGSFDGTVGTIARAGVDFRKTLIGSLFGKDNIVAYWLHTTAADGR